MDLDEGRMYGSTEPVCVMYDKRFQQIKSNLFTTILRDCDPATPEIEPCDLELILSTLAVHSFDFVGHDIPGGILGRVWIRHGHYGQWLQWPNLDEHTAWCSAQQILGTRMWVRGLANRGGPGQSASTSGKGQK